MPTPHGMGMLTDCIMKTNDGKIMIIKIKYLIIPC